MPFKREEVAILMQQLMPVFDAESGNQAIDRAPNRESPLA
jgi:hypothetical protein